MENKAFIQKSKEDYVLTPDEENAIQRKTEELYEKRIAPHVPDISPLKRETIIRFQKLVFVLDHYFEHNEQLAPAILDSVWTRFEKFLDDLEMPKDLQATLLQDIKDYADIEAGIRIGKKLAECEIRFFYFKKSCDVRMQRHIIRYLNTQPALSSEPEIIRDILEEIEDDVDDIAEDKLTPFGGNRFLEILDSKDVEKLDEYTTFVNSLPNAPQDLVQRILDKMSKFKV